ncbi:MAG: AraC family transcriptional regulator [Rhodococcus sp. (in: high G+C Gram-positive bacteria)]|nr:MAG: AraC family transcriptional regulator [Rhodococcus sp. (in: high G+C Gram-positive bacteria)]
MYVVEDLRTRDLDARERGDWWRDRVSSIHCPMSFSLSDEYRGKLQHQRSDHYQLVRWWGDAETLTRDDTEIRRYPHDSYELLIPVRGELTLRQADTSFTVKPTTMVLTSLDTALDLRHGDNVSSFALVIPRERLGSRLTRAARGPGVLLDAGRGLGRIVADQICSLREQRDELDGAEFDAVADRIVDLLALTCNGVVTESSPPAGDALVESIKRYIRGNAHDPDLTGAHVAAHLGWSLRHIQTQLQRVGTTPSDLIREERLALSRLRLQDPTWRHQSVTQIAYSSGFGDLSTFSNSYRRSFGERPSETRAGVLLEVEPNGRGAPA